MTAREGIDGEVRRALARLEEVDARIDAVSAARSSLAPGGLRARPLAEVARGLLRGSRVLDAAFVDGLARVGEAQVESFPDNLFWDFDAFAASVHRQAEAAADPVALLDEVCGIACELMALFGERSPIRFRYVHDFMYGFDWSRWVAREPASRGGVGPFDLPFLRYVFGRGHELLGLIAEDDAKYHRLRDGRHRNPFGFSREPEDERLLLEALARDGLVPVEAWECEPRAIWDRPYAAIRAARAKALGLAR